MRIGIGLPLYKNVEAHFFKSFIGLLRENEYDIDILTTIGTTIDQARNELVRQAQAKNYDYIWFIDTDHIIPKGTLTKLLKVMKDKKAMIVSGLYFSKTPPIIPVIRKVTDGFAEPIVDFKGIIEADGLGLGCCLIDMKVFEKIEFPYFECGYKNHYGFINYYSEDITFCNKIREKGIKIYVDTDLIIQHIGGITGLDDYLPYREGFIKAQKIKDKLLSDLSEYDKIPKEHVIANLNLGVGKHKEEWDKVKPKTKEEREKFYKESYWSRYDLGGWHLGNRIGYDGRLVKFLKKEYPKKDCSILDYGCGIGQNSYLLAKEGFKDITLHDLNLDFAEFRFKKHNLPYKKLDLAKKYDVILCFDVLEHLDDKDFEETINLFKKLKKGKVIITVSFGDNGAHPMHFEGNEKKIKMVNELMENGVKR